ncbi:MAG: DUF2167 domain-containing protein [Woeseiaceae bacterium]
MNKLLTSLAAASLVLCAPVLAQEPAAGEEEMSPAQLIYNSLDFSQGPGTYDVTSRAEINIPDGYDRLSPQDTGKLMELYGNPAGPNEYYVAPTDERWFSIFIYDDTGHIKDDEEIDADALLDSIREGTKAGNEQRAAMGSAPMSIVGWQSKPHYDETTNRLSWAVLAESEGEQIVNYNTRMLGRTGVMSATLVASPDTLDTSIAEFEEMLTGFNYKTGNLYAEYKEGDKLAQYGLAALVTGGAAVAVAKGAGKGLFKIIGLGIVAFFAFFGRIFKNIFSRKRDE